MRVMGVDPGTATVGYAVIDADWPDLDVLAYGAIRTSKNISQDERLYRIYFGIRGLLEEYKPDSMAVEQLFFARNVTNAMSVSEARGVIQLAARTYQKDGIPCYSYKPNAIKKTVAGHGKAKKPEVQEAVRVYLGMSEPIKPDDAADALAIAITHITEHIYEIIGK